LVVANLDPELQRLTLDHWETVSPAVCCAAVRSNKEHALWGVR
jgi:hypothetical protein